MQHRAIVPVVLAGLIVVLPPLTDSTPLYRAVQTKTGGQFTRASVEFEQAKAETDEAMLRFACFDNRCSMSIALPSIDRPAPVKASAHEVFVREDSCVEWSVILAAAPDTNVLTYPIQTEGLVFYYQDTLNDLEKSFGAERPDSVIYSWAAYRSVEQMNNPDPTEFGIGKAFHVYRPKVWDSNTDTVWADLGIDTVQGRLSIRIDPAFLKRAHYPVTIDPTFGFSSGGASSTSLSAVEAWGNKNGQYFYTAGGGEHIDSLYAYLKSYSAGTYYADLAVYSVESGNPSERLGSAATVPGSGSAVTWRGINVNATVASGVTYTLCIGDPVNGTRVQYDSGISGQNSRQTTSTLLGPTWNHNVDGTMLLSIYAVYSTGEVPQHQISMRRRKAQQRWLNTGER